ncbi:hypothetical protein D3C71_1968200 [compost metagenome]
MLEVQFGVGGAELRQQPAGVFDAPVAHQVVEQQLVVLALVLVANEPAKSCGAGALGFEKVFGEFHGGSREQWRAARDALRQRAARKAPQRAESLFMIFSGDAHAVHGASF